MEFFELMSSFMPCVGFAREKIQDAVSRAIDFLYKNQLDSGEFRVFASHNPEMQECYQDSSTFITTFVLYSLKDMDNNRVKDMTKKPFHFY